MEDSLEYTASSRSDRLHSKILSPTTKGHVWWDTFKAFVAEKAVEGQLFELRNSGAHNPSNTSDNHHQTKPSQTKCDNWEEDHAGSRPWTTKKARRTLATMLRTLLRTGTFSVYDGGFYPQRHWCCSYTPTAVS